MDIQQTLHDIFGFSQFLPGQEEIIRRLVDGASALAVFPTGQGKSLCYQLTALQLPGLTLVVSPLVALMKDQVDFLAKKNLAAARLDSSLSHEEYAAVRQDLTSGRTKLLYVAPERFANERFLAALRPLNISMMVIDEAHCISEWGHNFRPDYLKLAGISRELAIPVTLCLTATATPKVAGDICKAFAIAPENYIQTGFYRPNLTLRFSPSTKPQATLLQRLQERRPGATIVYVTLQATAEKVADTLDKNGFSARPYHAGLKDDERSEVQEWFMASDQAIVVATIAFGMGIDKADIRYIYHYNLPKSLENYTQEIGRAGRDGQPAVCELLGNGRDLTVLENFSYGDTPDDEAIREFTAMILRQPDHFAVSVYELSREYDMRPLVVNTMLTYLELEKIISSTGPFYTTYTFLPHKTSAEIFARFDQERAGFLRGMFSCARKRQKWFSLDIDEVMAKQATSRRRVVAALNYLEEQGDLELKVSGVRRGFKVLRRPGTDEAAALTARLQENFRIREEQDIKRLGMVVSLIGRQACQTRFLLHYFGEELPENCGHCEFCLSGNAPGKSGALVDERPAAISTAAVARIRETLDEHHAALTTTRQQTRFFCGLSSPQTRRAGLLRHQAFGIIADHPFGRVKEWLESESVTT
ncbi:MAG TPA: RecQ family ATP-dependent DNA helicase [Desulfobacteraceae bacterium]|nr:RecQ family ATP-dependent DNA helicase [Desulfobacteraceae bacterium]